MRRNSRWPSWGWIVRTIPSRPPIRQPFPDLERELAKEPTGRDHRIRAPQLVQVSGTPSPLPFLRRQATQATAATVTSPARNLQVLSYERYVNS
jgi:hypothetical protein